VTVRPYISLGVFISFCCFPLWAKSSPREVHNELPAPYSLQAVVLGQSVSLSWQWQMPEQRPLFLEFGFEVKRSDGKIFSASGTTYTDNRLAAGDYTYLVRARGITKEKRKRVMYISDWSEPVSATIQWTCRRPPVISLKVESTQKAYQSIPSLRFHITGQVTVEDGCTLGAVKYHLDTGTGIAHDGLLPVDPRGHFDTFINAFGPDDEIPSGNTTFSITALADDEAGPTISDVFTIEVELRNPFAPR
jgi:hypothetical protein